jgi:hypothetical protein
MSDGVPAPRFEESTDAQRLMGDAGLSAGAIVESFVLLLALKAIEALFFGPGYFASLGQHPFWIVVLLAAIQHGLFTGVITAGLAGLMMDWPPRPVDVDITAHYLEVAILPLQWLTAALCIGLFRQTQIREQRRLNQENAKLEGMNKALASEIARLDETIGRFELEAVTRSQEGADAFGSLGALHDASPEELMARFDEAAADCLALSTRLLLPLEDQSFADRSGQEPLPGLDSILHFRDPLITCAYCSTGAVLYSREADEGEPRRRFVVAGIRLDGSRELVAIVAVAAGIEGDTSADIGRVIVAATLLASAAAIPLSRAMDEPVVEARRPEFRLVVNG